MSSVPRSKRKFRAPDADSGTKKRKKLRIQVGLYPLCSKVLLTSSLSLSSDLVVAETVSPSVPIRSLTPRRSAEAGWLHRSQFHIALYYSRCNAIKHTIGPSLSIDPRCLERLCVEARLVLVNLANRTSVPGPGLVLSHLLAPYMSYQNGSHFSWVAIEVLRSMLIAVSRLKAMDLVHHIRYDPLFADTLDGVQFIVEDTTRFLIACN
ncbi:hypothetical protein C8J57DRAFT_1527032 [Mycena rebaudengoi]|nr:hypothetical protein C8J57DRAFT_1527032 [Mycena rebaudengoi]